MPVKVRPTPRVPATIPADTESAVLAKSGIEMLMDDASRGESPPGSIRSPEVLPDVASIPQEELERFRASRTNLPSGAPPVPGNRSGPVVDDQQGTSEAEVSVPSPAERPMTPEPKPTPPEPVQYRTAQEQTPPPRKRTLPPVQVGPDPLGQTWSQPIPSQTNPAMTAQAYHPVRNPDMLYIAQEADLPVEEVKRLFKTMTEERSNQKPLAHELLRRAHTHKAEYTAQRAIEEREMALRGAVDYKAIMPTSEDESREASHMVRYVREGHHDGVHFFRTVLTDTRMFGWRHFTDEDKIVLSRSINGMISDEQFVLRCIRSINRRGRVTRPELRMRTVTIMAGFIALSELLLNDLPEPVELAKCT